MNKQKEVQFRYLYFNLYILYSILVPLLFVYVGEILFFFKTHQDLSPAENIFISNWIGFGVLSLVLIPLIFATVRSVFILSPDGVIEKRGYFWGLFRTVVNIPWSAFVSYDKNFIYIPTERKSEPQINLYYKKGGCVRVNKRTRGGLWVNDRNLKWDAFSKHLVELFGEKGLPSEAPKSEKSKRMWFIVVLGILGGLLLLSMIAYVVVSMVARPEIFYLLVLVALVMLMIWLTLRRRRW